MEPAVETLDEVRNGAAVGDTPSFEVSYALGCDPPAELVEEPRFADPGVADDTDELTLPGHRRCEPALQHVQLLAPPDEGGHQRGGGAHVRRRLRAGRFEPRER